MRELKEGIRSRGIVGTKLENQTYSDGTHICVGDIVRLDGGVDDVYDEVYVINNHPNGLLRDFTKGVSGDWKCKLVKRHHEVETGYICEGIEMVEQGITTIEMLKELTENPEKVFEATGISGDTVYVRMAEDHNGSTQRVLIKATGLPEDSIKLNHITLNYKWTEFVEKEYTFEEAFDECKKNGTKFYREYEWEPNDEMYLSSGEVVINFKSEEREVCLGNRPWKKRG